MLLVLGTQPSDSVTPMSSSVTESCLTLCDPVDFSTPGFLVLLYLLELAQVRVR